MTRRRKHMQPKLRRFIKLGSSRKPDEDNANNKKTKRRHRNRKTAALKP